VCRKREGEDGTEKVRYGDAEVWDMKREEGEEEI
jgi:hypothetical protein